MFGLARSQVGGVFAHMTFLLPVERLYESSDVIAFYHPRPTYEVHVLLVPKTSIKRMTDITEADSGLVIEIFQAVKYVVETLDIEETGYRLITNGGRFQDVQQLHFHLVSGRSLDT
jgi:histidine triad (HIT) family protein